MTLLQELILNIDGLDADGPNYLEIRAIKRIAHNLQKVAENIGAETA